MSDAKLILWCFVALLALGFGAMIPIWAIEIDVSDPTMERSRKVIHLAMLFYIVFSFHWAGRKFPKLHEWSTNTFLGAGSMLFAAGFLLTLTSSLYMLVPLPAWLHLSGSIALGLVSSVCMLSTFEKERRRERS